MTAPLKHDSRSGHIAVTLPLPPSVNRMYIRTRSGVTCTPEYKRWKHEAGWTVKAARVKPLSCEMFGCEIMVPSGMRGDADNRAKAIIDLFVALELVPDDRCLAILRVERSKDIATGQANVRFWRMTDFSVERLPFVSLFEAQSAEAG